MWAGRKEEGRKEDERKGRRSTRSHIVRDAGLRQRGGHKGEEDEEREEGRNSHGRSVQGFRHTRMTARGSLSLKDCRRRRGEERGRERKKEEDRR